MTQSTNKQEWYLSVQHHFPSAKEMRLVTCFTDLDYIAISSISKIVYGRQHAKHLDRKTKLGRDATCPYPALVCERADDPTAR